MKLYISHPRTRDNQTTNLAADFVSATGTIKVKNTSGFVTGKFAILGSIGFEQSEIVRPTTITAPDTLVLSSATVFPHNADTKVTFLDQDKINIYRSTSGVNGSYSLLAAVNIQIDNDVTMYDDTTSTAGSYYKFSYLNSFTSVESDFSDPVAASGFQFASLKTMTDRVLSLFGDKDEEKVTRDEVKDYLNEIYEKAQQLSSIASKRFNTQTTTFVTVSKQTEYDLPADFLMEKSVKASTDNGSTFPYWCASKQVDSIGTAAQTNCRYGYWIYGSKIVLDDPIPSSNDSIKVYYFATPISLSLSTDTLQAPFINSSAVFVKYALAHCYLKDKDMENYKTLRDDAITRLNEHLSFIKIMSNRHVSFTEIVDTTLA